METKEAGAVEQVQERCENCKFYRAFPEGSCRRNPPTAFPLPSGEGILTLGVFAPTKATNWCGEYKAAA